MFNYNHYNLNNNHYNHHNYYNYYNDKRDNLTDELKRLVEVNLQLNGDWRLVLSDSDSPNAFFNA